jgi:hypothetical protein
VVFVWEETRNIFVVPLSPFTFFVSPLSLKSSFLVVQPKIASKFPDQPSEFQPDYVAVLTPKAEGGAAAAEESAPEPAAEEPPAEETPVEETPAAE